MSWRRRYIVPLLDHVYLLFHSNINSYFSCTDRMTYFFPILGWEGSNIVLCSNFLGCFVNLNPEALFSNALDKLKYGWFT